MTELKPCPFCGGTPTLEEPGADGAQRVVCCNIRCFGPATSPVVYAADAIAMWNRRPSPSISEGEVLREALDRIAEATVNSTNSWSAHEAFAWCAAVAETALEVASKARATTEVEVGWQPIETARKQVDETVLLRIEHMNYAIASDDDKHRWEEVVTAYWTDFNAGGWVWHGLAGSPTHWREIPPPPRTP